MNITVRLFAMLKQQAGTSSLQIDLPTGTTVAEAARAAGRAAGITELVARMPLAHAVNREYAEPDVVLAHNDELALIPPVSGGAPEPARLHARVTTGPIDSADLERLVADPRAGAVVTFRGVTRDVERLEYDAYAEMAEPLMLQIIEQVAQEHAVIAIAAEHRTGSVLLGQSSVVISVSGAHREETFAAARDAIDRIKAELPVWKLEVDGDEEQAEWVAGTPAPGALR